MKTIRIFLVAALAFGSVPALTVTSAEAAGTIERACKTSDRHRGTAPLCQCIQGVANQLLTRSEQRLAASFFANPDKAQKIRMSDNRRDENFWKRYKDFGSVAARACG